MKDILLKAIVLLAFASVALAVRAQDEKLAEEGNDVYKIMTGNIVAVYDSLLTKAKSSFQEKRYAESTEYYRELISQLEANGHGGTLVPKLREMIAINNLYIANEYSRNKEFDQAIDLLSSSIPLCIEGSKTYQQLKSSLATNYSYKSVILRYKGDFAAALESCERAEESYKIAGREDEVIKQMISHSEILMKMGRNREAQTILNEVIETCGTNSDYVSLKTEALCSLAKLELDIEDFQNAIRHAEMAYQISKDRDKHLTSLSASILWSIYQYFIPDREKAESWNTIYETNKQ